MRQRSRPAVPNDAAAIENFLELNRSFFTLTSRQIRLAANVGRIQARLVDQRRKRPVLDWRRGRLEGGDRRHGILPVEFELCLDCGQQQRLHLRIQRGSAFSGLAPAIRLVPLLPPSPAQVWLPPRLPDCREPASVLLLPIVLPA